MRLQVSTLAVGDSSGVQELQLALERIQSSSSSVHDAEPPAPDPAVQPAASPSSPKEDPRPKARSLGGLPSDEAQPASSSPQNPDAAAYQSFQPSNNPWDPWAEQPTQQSSSPQYLPGSSDSDWEEQQHQHDHQDDPGSVQNQAHMSGSLHHEAQAAEAPASMPQSPAQGPNPRIGSAMAEAQHRVDQLAGLAASHAEVQETLARDSDLGYAWGLMGKHIQQLQQQVTFLCFPSQSSCNSLD